MKRGGVFAWTTLAVAAGCNGQAGSYALPSPDLVHFTEAVSPILEASCGSVACHGDASRPFALYAPRQRRADPGALFDKTPLTSAEVLANYRATLGFLDASAALETSLLGKSLGRLGHTAVFEAPGDPDCRALRAWIGEAP